MNDNDIGPFLQRHPTAMPVIPPCHPPTHHSLSQYECTRHLSQAYNNKHTPREDGGARTPWEKNKSACPWAAAAAAVVAAVVAAAAAVMLRTGNRESLPRPIL
ncbi:hypothetical protein NW754_010080 [Fusarium falciforme]|uniref:Uncharacterized protein n=1 Tax=Fusarium falciforme TaxID=195108 RepID=A0A9W8V3X0_9HYPO|nr:hypothetical protein NW754_010080 [Fusarium falciforme]KAJ4190851.1 hypothetical protein NW755_005062 [Fusarium falciforme]